MVVLVQEREVEMNWFIDWDKCKNIFYNNIYLKDCKAVIKMNFIPKERLEEEIKIKKFNLGKYTYLCSY